MVWSIYVIASIYLFIKWISHHSKGNFPKTNQTTFRILLDTNKVGIYAVSWFSFTLALQHLSTCWVPGTGMFLCSPWCMRPPPLPSGGSDTACKESLDTPFLLGHVLHVIYYEVFFINIFMDIITQYLNVFQQHFTVWITSVICCLFSLPFCTWGMEMNAVTFLVPEGILKKNKHIYARIYVYRDDRVKVACFVWKNHVSGLPRCQLWGTSLHYLTQPPQTLSFLHK